MQTSQATNQTGAFELRFVSLFNPGRALAFPCDERGNVDMDSISERARNNYFAARACIGREYGCPQVLRIQQH